MDIFIRYSFRLTIPQMKFYGSIPKLGSNKLTEQLSTKMNTGKLTLGKNTIYIYKFNNIFI